MRREPCGTGRGCEVRAECGGPSRACPPACPMCLPADVEADLQRAVPKRSGGGGGGCEEC